MLDKIKHLAKHSFVYSISNVALKASGIILLPLYTKYFTLEEYGQLGLLLITIIIFSQSLVLGQGLSIIRFNNTVGYEGKRKSVFFTITFFILIIITLFLILTETFLTEIASLFGDPAIYEHYLNICIYIVAVITINNLFLSKLRADDRSVTYTISGIVKLLVMIVFSIYFIVYQRTGIEGVLYAQLAGELSNTVFVLPLMLKEIKPVFDSAIIKESLRYGFPLIFSSMAINLLNGSDRYIIKYLLGDAQLGLYELAYKVAGVHNICLIIPFNLTLFPLAFKLFKKKMINAITAKSKHILPLLWFGQGWLFVFSVKKL
jgi:Membrane protein involved in the export of O-antigen and teichoic acid